MLISVWQTSVCRLAQTRLSTAVADFSLPYIQSEFALDYGEREAIFLAEELGADAILIDEKDGRRETVKLGFVTIGTLSVLDRAAETNLISFAEAIARLRRTQFREPKLIVEALLEKHKQR